MCFEQVKAKNEIFMSGYILFLKSKIRVIFEPEYICRIFTFVQYICVWRRRKPCVCVCVWGGGGGGGGKEKMMVTPAIVYMIVEFIHQYSYNRSPQQRTEMNECMSEIQGQKRF